MLIFMFVFIHQGHNLGHHHSGKDGVTYADPTCNMGNQGESAALVLVVTVGLLLESFVFSSILFCLHSIYSGFRLCFFSESRRLVRHRIGLLLQPSQDLVQWLVFKQPC